MSECTHNCNTCSADCSSRKTSPNDFLEKPIERSVLERVLRRTLPEHKFATVRNIGFADHKSVSDSNPDWLHFLEDSGLDVKKAILYCNGKEAYYKILQGYCRECERTEKQLEELYQNQDWKNYTIAVHGLKSAMHSIGALKLSEIAKLLEMAGKNQDIDYILEHHNQLMVEFKYLFTKLQIHVFTDKQAEPEKIPAEERYIKEKVIAELLNELYSIYMNPVREELLAEYKNRSIVTGKNILILRNGGEEEAFAIDINDDYSLLVKKENGEIENLNTGDVSIKI